MVVGEEGWIGGCYLVVGEREIGRVGRGVYCANMDVEYMKSQLPSNDDFLESDVVYS